MFCVLGGCNVKSIGKSKGVWGRKRVLIIKFGKVLLVKNFDINNKFVMKIVYRENIFM